MLIGYARISTQDQNLNLQQDALEKSGCDRVFTDTISGSKSERMGLREAGFQPEWCKIITQASVGPKYTT